MKVETLKSQARQKEREEAWGEALEAYRKVARILEERDDPDISLYNRMGDLELRIGDSEGALETFDRAIEFYEESGLLNNAVGVCKKVIRNLPDRDTPYLRLGRLRAEQGLRADARQAFLTYAERKQSKGELDDALEALVEFADLAPDEHGIREMVADRLASHGRTDEAVEQYLKLHRGLMSAGDSEQAQKVAETIHQLDPDVEIPEGGAEEGPQSAGDDLLGGAVFDPTIPADDEGGEEAGTELGADPGDGDSLQEGTVLEDPLSDPGPREELPSDELAGEGEDSEPDRPLDEIGGLEDDPLEAASSGEDQGPAATEEAEVPGDEGQPEGGAVLSDDDLPSGADSGDDLPSGDDPLSGDGPPSGGDPTAGDAPPSDDAPPAEEDPLTTLEAPEREPEHEEDDAAALGALGDALLDEEAGGGPDRSESGAPSTGAAGPEAPPEGGYVDLGALILGDEEEEKDTRMKVPTQTPTGDEDADFSRMLEQFKEKVAENLETDNARDHYDLGTAYKGMGLLDEAIAQLQQALRAEPEGLHIYEVLGQCFLGKGETRAAVQLLERARRVPVPVEDERIGVYYDLARAYEEEGDVEKARELYERVFTLDINFKDITDRLRRVRSGGSRP